MSAPRLRQNLHFSSVPAVVATRAPKDSTIYFRAEGADARAALDALVTLVDEDFQDGR